ncbi:MAG TPA: undecaprenyl/decaprenyl-phosphate alpha-N-acetylglucosaminyl 1-phosphate transferase [Cytophagales bacterium]|nr:undecaprenyl/decaprenyl-phosphate alpha-N-acetylglucosaminyl 1-phosphate transferase [Cytophagales bacterium]
MQSLTFLFTPVLAFVISFLLFPVLIKLLTRWELYDSDKDHMIHKSFKPSMGGIVIYLGLILSLVIALPFQEWVKLKYVFIGVTLMFMIGLRDDVLGLNPAKKLVSQLLPISILVVFGNVFINVSILSFDFYELPVWLNLTIAIIVIVLITNSYNLIDGLDGLAGTIGAICLTIFGIWFYWVDSMYFGLIAFSAVGTILSFLIFNWQPSKIFMGDTGALLIGLLLSYFSIEFLNYNSVLPGDRIMKFQSSIGTLICILIIPVFDTSRVVIFRLRKGLSPFRADKNHIHHQFLKLGFSHAKSVLSIASINVIFILLAWLLRNQPDGVILPLVVILCLFINFALKWAQKNAGTHNETI